MKISQCCLYHAYLSSYYLQIDTTLRTYNGLKILIQSNTYQNVSMTVTSIIREVQIHEKNAVIQTCQSYEYIAAR